MNIQIFGAKKSFDTKKAERYFKERGIRYQYIDLNEKGISRGELQNVARAVGGPDALVDRDCRDKQLLTLYDYLVPEQRLDKLLDEPVLLRTPIVRNGRQATVGFCPEVWKGWE